MGSLDVTSAVSRLPRPPNDELPVTSESLLTENNNPPNDKNKKTVLLIMEKVNMVFLIVLVCYLSWTIPATFGLFDPPTSAPSKLLQNKNKSLLNETDSLIVSIMKIFWLDCFTKSHLRTRILFLYFFGKYVKLNKIYKWIQVMQQI